MLAIGVERKATSSPVSAGAERVETMHDSLGPARGPGGEHHRDRGLGVRFGPLRAGPGPPQQVVEGEQFNAEPGEVEVAAQLGSRHHETDVARR
jgi:hypothetical protein